MKNRAGKSTAAYLLLMLFLAVAVTATTYFLYLRPHAGDKTGLEVAAKIDLNSSALKTHPRLKHKLSPKEQKAIAKLATPKAELKEPSGTKTKADQPQAASLPETQEALDTQSPPAASSAPQTEKEEKTAPQETTGLKEKAAFPSRGGPVWVINVLSTQDGDKALDTLNSLINLPYQVYSYQKKIKGRNWYRIRVGFFFSRKEAERVGRQLTREHGLPPPWIVKPSHSEAVKYYQR